MHTLAAVSWNPQLRGALIVLTGALILCGSVYLLLSTNLGARLGFLTAVAGLAGWLVLLNILWLWGPLGNGSIGYKGVQNGWSVKEIVQGDLLAHSTTKAIVGNGTVQGGFPNNGWTQVKPTAPSVAAAAPVADKAFLPPAAGAKATSAFPPPYKTSTDYVDVAAYTKGGHSYLVNILGYKIFWRIRHHQIFIKHQPHYLIFRAQASLPSITLAGAAATLPAPDASAPIYSVVMVKDDGSLRLPPILLGLSSLLVFALACEQLHTRDKRIERRLKDEDESPNPQGKAAGELQPA